MKVATLPLKPQQYKGSWRACIKSICQQIGYTKRNG